MHKRTEKKCLCLHSICVLDILQQFTNWSLHNTLLSSFTVPERQGYHVILLGGKKNNKSGSDADYIIVRNLFIVLPADNK